jgi:hypothetical protein
MRSASHHPRFTLGDQIIVAPSELMGVTGEELTKQLSDKGNKDMAGMTEVDGLVSLTQTVANIKALASDAAKRFQGSVANVNDAITTTHTVSDQLDKAAGDIRTALGVSSNGPPSPNPTT